MTTTSSTAHERESAGPSTPRPATPPHLAELPGGRWTVWREVVLRGAGFPTAYVLALADDAGAESADRLLQAEDDARAARSAALDALWRALNEAEPGRRPALDKVIRRLQKGKPPQSAEGLDACRDEVEAFAAAQSRVAAAREAFRGAFGAAAARVSARIGEAVRSADFREALIWQNLHAYRTAVEPLLRRPAGEAARDSKHRQHEELVANYLQRYCVKNDTIGFFGPVGWARVTAGAEPVRAEPGPGLLAARHVRFEAWCIDALVERFLRRDDVRPWVAPRRVPLIHLEGATLHLPFGRNVGLAPAQAAVLGACDGERTAKELARDLARARVPGLGGEEDVYRVLEGLVEAQLATWDFSLTVPYDLNPEQTVRRFCERVEEPGLSRPVLRALDLMEEARAAVAAAAGDPDRLERSLTRLEETFTGLTGAAPTRAAGQMYAARTLVYEDCRRDADVEIGAGLLAELGPPLSLLLTSARWLTAEVAARYRRVFEQLYEQSARATGSPVVEATNVWLKARPLVYDESPRLVRGVVALFQKHWAKLLDVAPGARRVQYSSEELRGRVEEAFAAPDVGWSHARYNSPDVMVAAPSLEAFARGDYLLVLGELHAASITLTNWLFLAQHESPERLIACKAADQAAPQVILTATKYQPTLTVRTTRALLTEQDYFLESSHEASSAPPGRRLPIGELVLERRAGGVVVRTRDGRLQFDVVEFLGHALSSAVMNAVKVFPPSGHTPRLTIDRLVVCREQWTFGPPEMPFAQEADEASRFVAARRWARAHGMPRFVFVKTPAEVKPFYVDFDSHIYVNIFAKMIRRAAAAASPGAPPRITVSEMLPTAEQTFLPDAEGRRYTSEFRFVAFEPPR